MKFSQVIAIGQSLLQAETEYGGAGRRSCAPGSINMVLNSLMGFVDPFVKRRGLFFQRHTPQTYPIFWENYRFLAILDVNSCPNWAKKRIFVKKMCIFKASWMTILLHGAHPKFTRESDRRIAVRRRGKRYFFWQNHEIFGIFRKKKSALVSPVFSKNLPLQKRSFFPFFWLFGGVGFLKKQVKPHHIFFFPKNPKISRFRQKKRHFPSLRTTILLSDCLVILGWAPCRGIVIQGTSKMRIFFTKISFFVQFGQEFTSKMAKNLCFSQKVG